MAVTLSETSRCSWTEFWCLGVHQARCASRLRIRRPNVIHGPKTNPAFFAHSDRVNQPDGLGPAIVLLAHEDWRGGENSAREGRGGSSGGGLLSRCDGLLCPLVPPRQDPVRLARRPLRRRPPPQRRPPPLQRRRPPPLLQSRSPHLLRR
jgi:hypothetical protein